VRYQRNRGHIQLWGYPLILTLEAANLCNLRCPYCFVGAGEKSRPPIPFPFPLYQRIIDELGDYLLHVEFHNWAEPLLNQNLPEYIQLASARGISTVVATHFSLPFDRARAEALVASGLSLLGVSLDGARQETYEQYRVGGNFATVLANIRLVNQAKRAQGSQTPRVIWSFHVFAHNCQDVELARTMARDLGIEFSACKGWVEGPDWDPEGKYAAFFAEPQPGRAAEHCQFLWERAIIHGDGGVAPCDGTFFREDDFGLMNARRFREVWNNDSFQEARRLFRSRQQSDEARRLICYSCPATLTMEHYRQHLAQGGHTETFAPRFSTNDGFNFFFNTRWRHRSRPGTSRQPIRRSARG